MLLTGTKVLKERRKTMAKKVRKIEPVKQKVILELQPKNEFALTVGSVLIQENNRIPFLHK